MKSHVTEFKSEKAYMSPHSSMEEENSIIATIASVN